MGKSRAATELNSFIGNLAPSLPPALSLVHRARRRRCYLHLPALPRSVAPSLRRSVARMLTAFGSGRPSTICLRVPSDRPTDRPTKASTLFLARLAARPRNDTTYTTYRSLVVPRDEPECQDLYTNVRLNLVMCLSIISHQSRRTCGAPSIELRTSFCKAAIPPERRCRGCSIAPSLSFSVVPFFPFFGSRFLDGTPLVVKEERGDLHRNLDDTNGSISPSQYCPAPNGIKREGNE